MDRICLCGEVVSDPVVQECPVCTGTLRAIVPVTAEPTTETLTPETPTVETPTAEKGKAKSKKSKTLKKDKKVN